MKNYIVEFWNEKGYNDYCPQTMYLTEKALNEFLFEFEKKFKENCKYYSFKREGNIIMIDVDFGIIWKEYIPQNEPTFVNKLPQYMEVDYSNNGHQSTCLCIEMYS
jgi:hypothetical protein